MTIKDSTFTWSLIITAAVTVVMCLLILKTCNKPVATDFDVKAYADSVNRANAAREHIIDSLEHIDSMKSVHLIEAAKKSVYKDSLLRVAVHRADLLAKKYQEARAALDTSAALVRCDSLADQITELTGAVADYEETNRELFYQLRDVQASAAATNRQKDSLYNDLKGAFDFLAVKYSKLDYNYSKAAKPRRWSVGPQIGATYDGKVKMTAGVGVTYCLIRF